MTDTPNLALPCIEGSQAQKHVTHNDALRILDTLVQLAVADRDLTAPPGSPGDGQRWIVKAVATGAWAGHNNAIAAWQDGAWIFSPPQTGWLAYIVDEGALVAWSGSAWIDAIAALTSLNNMTLLGVGTAADATNPFSAKLNNILWIAKTLAEGGNGDLRWKMSKESAANTLSMLFQDNYSGRAELGLTGDDNFHIKVSPDGATWREALVIDKSSGQIALSQGLAVPRGYVSGLTLSNNSGTPNTKLDVAAGVCRDSTDSFNIKFSATTTIDCTTMGANGLDAGALANSTFYYVFAIAKADGTTAMLMSTSSTSPTLPSGYIYKRRIRGAVCTDGSAHFLAFRQVDRTFFWPTPMINLSGAPGDTLEHLFTINVPPIAAEAILGGYYQHSSAASIMYLSSPQDTNVVPSGTNFTVQGNVSTTNFPFYRRIVTSSGQARYRVTASGGFISVGTEGWVDLGD